MSGERQVSTLQVAAALLVLYGAVVLLGALLYAPEAANARGLVRAAVRFGGMLLIGWGLVQRERWAWWLGVIVSGGLSLLSLAAFAGLSTAAQNVSAIVGPLFWLGVVPLLAAFVVLLLPSSRSALKA